MTPPIPKLPTDPDWLPVDLVGHILELRVQAYQQGMYGPYILVMGTGWGDYLKERYFPAKSELLSTVHINKTEGAYLRKTLAERITCIEGVQRIFTCTEIGEWDVQLYNLVG